MPITIIGNNGTGPPGPQGPGGTNGSNGSNGTNGANGINGANATLLSTILDFGSLPVSEQVFNIVNASVTSASKINGDLVSDRATKDADEDEFSKYVLNVYPHTGNFDVYVKGIDGYLHDKFEFKYFIG